MIQSILSYLGQLKLTLQQWIILVLSGLVGFLVLALRLQGSRLHRAQLQLLSQQVLSTSQADDEAVEASRARFLKALKDYHNASN